VCEVASARSRSSHQQNTNQCATAQVNLTTVMFGITAVTSEATSVDARTAPSSTAVFDSSSTWKHKVHGESTAQGWDSSIGSGSKVRLKSAATNFDVVTHTTSAGRRQTTPAGIIDIGTAIEDLIITESNIAKPVPTVHWEDSASEWESVTSTVHNERSALDWTTLVSSALARFESSADPWESTRDQDVSKPHSSRYIPVVVTDDPWTKNLRPSQVIDPSRQSHGTKVSSKTITEYPPPAAVTYDGITIQPAVITRRPTVTAPDGAVTTTDKVEFQAAIGSSTLKIGTPITINNIVVSLTTDAVGSTVLHAGDLTTILPEPTAGEVRIVAEDTPGRLSIMTSIVGSTTKFVLAGQTLAPGQPVTIGGTSISIALDGDNTILYVGDRKTTLSTAGADLQIITDLASVSSREQGTGANSAAASAEPTSKRSRSSRSWNVEPAFAYCVMSMAMFVFRA